jgi:hypothetical protein
MSTQNPTERTKQIYEYAAKNSPEAAAEHFGIKISYVYREIRKYNQFARGSGNEVNKEKRNWDEKDNEAIWNYSGDANITCLEEALEFSGVDLNIWEVGRHVFNTWTTTYKDDSGQAHQKWNIQVKIWFKKKVKELVLVNLKDGLIEDMKKYTPSYEKIEYENKKGEENCMLEIDLFDVHYNRLALAVETGEEYNIKIATARFKECICKMISYAKPYKIMKVLFPLGNDLLNSDTKDNRTTRGTRQDCCTRNQLAFRKMIELTVWAVDQLKLIAPVVIPIIPGNHDEASCFYLGEVLNAYYRNCYEVCIDNSLQLRKCHLYGNTLIGFTHGRHEKLNRLPLLMAQEFSILWSKAKYKEIHVAHCHHKTVNEFDGVRLRTMPTISGRHAWEYEQGYKAWKAAESFIWGEASGFKANFSVNYES